MSDTVTQKSNLTRPWPAFGRPGPRMDHRVVTSPGFVNVSLFQTQKCLKMGEI